MRTLNRNATPGYRNTMAEIRMADFGDPWSVAMGWTFGLAEVAYAVTGEVYPEFNPGPLLTEESIRDGDYGYEAEWLCDMLDAGEITDADMRDVYRAMSRYADAVRAAGRSY